MFDRKGVLAFLAILVSCLAGGFAISMWAMLASACVLTLISISNHDAVMSRLGGDAVTAQAAAMLSSLTNAIATAAGSYALGTVIGVIWGFRTLAW